MGYDEPECMICFVNDGNNEFTTKKVICSKCFDELITDKPRIGKIVNYISLRFDKCDKCLSEEKVLCYKIYCHLRHICEGGCSDSSDSDDDYY